MSWKQLLKKKTTWAGLALIVTGVGQIIAENDPARGIQTMLEGAAIIFLRKAIGQ